MSPMTKYLTGLVSFLSLAILIFCATHSPTSPIPNDVQIYRFSPASAVQTSLNDNPVSIRLLILKHSQEQMADDDARLAARGATAAAEKGLSIRVIGDQNATSLQKIEDAVANKIKVEAVPGDTLIVHTIGHGHQGGTLHNLGQRSGVVKILAKAAEENQQEILWWQLSCHAAAQLPSIDSLKEGEQDLLSMLASSTAAQESPTREQAEIMGKLFMALAEKNKNIDANGDGIITAGELRGFLNSLDNRKRGDLFFARNADKPIFGYMLLMRLIPIVDRNNPQGQYLKDYIPVPGRRGF